MTSSEPSPDPENHNEPVEQEIQTSGREAFRRRNIPNGENGTANPSSAPRSQFVPDFIPPTPPTPGTPRELNARDVCAFTVNNMIGTGIYTAPPIVLLLTNSKWEALLLWFVGFLYTLISMVMYLEFSRKMPHTGGELVYLDEILPRPRLLAYTIYSFYAVLIYNDATNSMQFARQVLICASDNPIDTYIDQRSLRFIAVVVLSFFCLLHYFSSRAGQDLNQGFAFIKTLLILVVIGSGIGRATHHYTSDWGHAPKGGSSSATAFLYILFSFSGWENATFVGSEIAEHKILKKGFIAGVSLVGVLYILVNLIFLLAVPQVLVVQKDSPAMAMAPLFFGDGEKAKRAWTVLIAISAAGSLLAVTYTCGRLKLVIGKSNILPWSRIWKMSSPERINGNGKLTSTPQGGLMLHWIFSVVLIAGSAGFYNLTEAISFPGNLQAYASAWVGVFIGIGFPLTFLERDSRLLRFLHLKYRDIPPPWERVTTNQSRLLTYKFFGFQLFWAFTIAFLAVNVFVIVVPVIKPYEDGNGEPLEIQGWLYITIVLAVILSACIYYLITFCFAVVRIDDNTHTTLIQQHNSEIDLGTNERGKSIISWAGVYPEIFEETAHDPRYGNRRNVVVFVDERNPKKSILYWIFGGSKPEHRQNFGLPAIWDQVTGKSS